MQNEQTRNSAASTKASRRYMQTRKNVTHTYRRRRTSAAPAGRDAVEQLLGGGGRTPSGRELFAA